MIEHKLADLDSLPEDKPIIIPTLDILLHEELVRINCLQTEITNGPKKHDNHDIDVQKNEGQFHGWNDCKYFRFQIWTRADIYTSAGLHT